MPLLRDYKVSSFIIAIDGPSATGKTTLSKALAEKVNFPLLLTGKIYRAYASILIKEKIACDDINRIIDRLTGFELSLLEENLEGELLAKIASIISSYPEVRRLADWLQFDFIQDNPKAILEGRDIGTVICPDANLKIFLTAEPEVRARRRLAESNNENYEQVLEQIIERDRRDSSREVSPLRPAPDAVIIDNSNLTQQEQLERVLSLLPASVFN